MATSYYDLMVPHKLNYYVITIDVIIYLGLILDLPIQFLSKRIWQST